MINVQNCGVKPYTFMDGDRIIFTNNPTQKLYKELQSSDISTTEMMDMVLEVMLHKEDKHYMKELPFDVKCALVQDYFTYHREQLEGRFPYPKSGQ